MPRPNPGTALVSEIAKHWAVSPPTARKILDAAGLKPVDAEGEGWERYRWEDIWRLEGEIYVPPAMWREFKAPLLDPKTMAAGAEMSERTLRRRRARGRIPTIELAPRVRRVRASVFDAALAYG